jgi:hypothetical protein
MVTPTELGSFLNRPIDNGQAASVIQVVTSFAKSYTRGQGWTDDGPNDEIASVVLSASARLISHTRQVGIDEAKGPESARFLASPFTWSVGELMVLNRFRVRAA